MYRFLVVTTVIIVLLAALAGVGAASPDKIMLKDPKSIAQSMSARL